jgi:dihydrofolate synthase/folylpolyglutamate synthase
MSYAAAVDHLYALGHELAPTPANTPRRKFDLEHMRILASALGNPQTAFPSVLIAGTNGKGSTAATLSSILTAAGYRTGLYTSPHLVRVNERIQIDGAEISDEDFARLYFQVDDTARHLVASGHLPHPPSFFEVLTALAFLYFAGCLRAEGTHELSAKDVISTEAQRMSIEREQGTSEKSVISTGPRAESRGGGETRFSTSNVNTPRPESPSNANQPVDIAILEVGLGGRLDATNIVDPLISIITDIALDHQDYLGNTITEITREKAGILRKNGTLITLPQHPEANQAIGEAAANLNLHAISAATFIPHLPPRASSQTVGKPEPDGQKSVISTEPRAESRGSGETRFSTANVNPHLPRNHYSITLDSQPLEVDSPLTGHHQQRNIALAIAAAEELRNPTSHKFNQNAPNRNQKSYKITNAAIETGIRNTTWPGRLELLSPNLLLDVAHNPAGAWTLRAAIAQLPEDQPRTLLFSCLRDKNLLEMSQILFPLFDSSADRPYDHILFAPIDNPRATTTEDLLSAARALDTPAQAAPDLATALELARSITPTNGLIIATGSVYLVGEIRRLAGKQ